MKKFLNITLYFFSFQLAFFAALRFYPLCVSKKPIFLSGFLWPWPSAGDVIEAFIIAFLLLSLSAICAICAIGIYGNMKKALFLVGMSFFIGIMTTFFQVAIEFLFALQAGFIFFISVALAAVLVGNFAHWRFPYYLERK